MALEFKSIKPRAGAGGELLDLYFAHDSGDPSRPDLSFSISQEGAIRLLKELMVLPELVSTNVAYSPCLPCLSACTSLH